MAIAYLGYKVDSSDVVKAEKRLERMDGAAGRADKGAGGLTSTARRLAVQLGAVAAAATAVRGAFRASQQYQQITNTLRGMGLSADQAAATLQSVADVANKTRAPLEATAKLYQRVSIAGKDLGASSQDVLRFTENIGLALASAGVGANESSGALLQLSQAMAGGVVRAEEFNSILEGAFPIAQAAANGIDAAGGSVGRLRNLVIEGKVSSEEFFNAILSQSGELQEAFDNVPATIGQAFTVLGNNLTMAMGQMDAALGLTSAVADGILFLAENTDFLAGTVIAASVAFVGSYVPSIYAAITATGAFSAALGVMRAALIATGIGALVVAAGYLIGKFISLVGAAGGVGNAFAAIKDIAIEVAGRIPEAWDGVQFKVIASALAMQGSVLGAFASILEGSVKAPQGIVKAFKWAVENITALFKSIGNIISQAVGQAVNFVLDKIEGLINKAVAGLNKLIDGLNNIPGVDIGAVASSSLGRVSEGVGGAIASLTDFSISSIAEGIRSTSDEMKAASKTASDMGDIFIEGATKPLEAVKRLREEMKAVNDVTGGGIGDIPTAPDMSGGGGDIPTAPDMSGGGGGLGGGGAAAPLADISAFEALRDRLQSETDVIEEWRTQTIDATNAAREQEVISQQEHNQYMLEIERLYQDQLSELQRNQQYARLGEAADFFGSLQSIAQQGGEGAVRAAKIFGAAQALINTFVAQSQVLADHKLGFFGKLAAYAKIGAAGLGLVKSIKSAGSGGGGGAGGAAASAASASTAPSSPQRTVRIEVQGDGMFADMLRENVDQIADAVIGNTRQGGAPIMVGR